MVPIIPVQRQPPNGWKIVNEENYKLQITNYKQILNYKFQITNNAREQYGGRSRQLVD